ncbi:MAG: hypothetical protein ACLS20_08495 [Faecalimonas umbilicata]
MGFSPKTRGRCWVGTIHVTNMEKAGLEKSNMSVLNILQSIL